MTREEAINTVRNIYQTDKEKEALEILIPELAESEDERVRKHIIAYLRNELHNIKQLTPTTTEMERWLAYLEKQKETGIRWFKSDNVKNPNKPYIDKAGMFYTTDGRMCYASEIEKQKGETLRDFIDNFPYSDEQKEQKPILEVFGFKVGDKVRLKDGDGRTHIIKKFEKIEGLHGPDFYHVDFEDNSARDSIYPGEEYPNGYYTQMEKLEEEQKPAEWDKLQEVFRNINEAFEDGKKEVVAHPKKYGLCKPTEWSDEDERMRQTAIEACKVVINDYENSNSRFYKCKDWLENKLVEKI